MKQNSIKKVIRDKQKFKTPEDNQTEILYKKFEKYFLERFPELSNRKIIFRRLISLFVLHKKIENYVFIHPDIKVFSTEEKINLLKKILNFYAFHRETLKIFNEIIPEYVAIKNVEIFF